MDVGRTVGSWMGELGTEGGPVGGVLLEGCSVRVGLSLGRGESVGSDERVGFKLSDGAALGLRVLVGCGLPVGLVLGGNVCVGCKLGC